MGNSFGTYMRAFREGNGETQESMSAKICVSQALLSQYEKGKMPPLQIMKDIKKCYKNGIDIYVQYRNAFLDMWDDGLRPV